MKVLVLLIRTIIIGQLGERAGTTGTRGELTDTTKSTVWIRPILLIPFRGFGSTGFPGGAAFGYLRPQWCRTASLYLFSLSWRTGGNRGVEVVEEER